MPCTCTLYLQFAIKNIIQGGVNISKANLTLRMDSELKEQASELFKAPRWILVQLHGFSINRHLDAMNCPLKLMWMIQMKLHIRLLNLQRIMKLYIDYLIW